MSTKIEKKPITSYGKKLGWHYILKVTKEIPMTSHTSTITRYYYCHNNENLGRHLYKTILKKHTK